MPQALVREPSPRLAEGLLTHIERRPVDPGAARRQWDGYVAAFADNGWQVQTVSQAAELPDSTFVEDTVVVRGDRALITRPGAPGRRPETTAVAEALTGLGYTLGHVEAPETLDGGDVLSVGPRTYVGVGGRTTRGACDQLAAFFESEVVPVPVRSVLHLKSAVTALPDGTVIGYPPLVDAPEVWEKFRPVPEEPGAHVVVLDARTVLMSAAAPRTAGVLRAEGWQVVTVDISEFEKLEGCVTCLSVRLR